MELSTAGLVGGVVGAVIGFIIYKVVFGLIEANLRKIDRPEAQRQEFERGLSRMRLVMLVGEIAVGTFLGYWFATNVLPNFA